MGGGIYVLFLALRFLRAGAYGGAAVARPAGFADGAILLILNPKAYAIIALMYSQFLGAAGAGDLGAIGWISTVFTLNNLAAFALWTLAGDRLAAGFRDTVAARRMNLISGALLAGVALWMLAT